MVEIKKVKAIGFFISRPISKRRRVVGGGIRERVFFNLETRPHKQTNLTRETWLYIFFNYLQ